MSREMPETIPDGAQRRESRTILVDADACPVREILVAQARKRRIPVVMLIDVNHEIHDGYSETVVVDQGPDSADYALIARVRQGDIVVTQDYGLASLALAKKAQAIRPDGMLFTAENIDALLDERYRSQKRRRAGERTRGPKKRTRQQDERFEAAFARLLDL